MYDRLNSGDKQSVLSIVELLDEETKNAIKLSLGTLLGNDNHRDHQEFVRNLVASIFVSNDSITDYVTLDDTILDVGEALKFTLYILSKYFKRDDTLPLEIVTDFYAMTSLSAYDTEYWQDIICENIDLVIPLTPTNPTAAIKAVINTAYSFTVQ